MLIQVYVHTRKYCSQNTTTLETRSHVQYDTIRKDHIRWQIRHRGELAGVGSASHENALQRESCHAPEWGDQGRASSNQDRARGSQEGEGFGVRPLAAEH